jgi:hypothetical protein
VCLQCSSPGYWHRHKYQLNGSSTYPNISSDAQRTQIQACGARVVDEESETELVGLLSFGGGVFGFIVSHVGVRADFRYYWQVPKDEEPFNYWRYTIGVVIH